MGIKLFYLNFWVLKKITFEIPSMAEGFKKVPVVAWVFIFFL